ncbi:MAG: PcfJ domain-containing protein [Ilumatobacteraceae bacterium]
MTRMWLTVTSSPDQLEFSVPNGGTGIRLTRHGHHATSRLLFAGGRSSVDISFQPGTIVREVDLAARDHSVEPQKWRQQVLLAVVDWWDGLGWCAREPQMLLAAIGAVTHPLLGAAYERGHEALGEIPRWASPVLRCTDPIAAARALSPSANRRTARALAASLVARPEGDEVELGNLAAAVCGSALLSADQLANVFEVAPPVRPAPAVTTEQMRFARHGIALYPADRATDLLCDALRTADMPILSESLQQLDWIADRVPRPLPARLRELQALCTRYVPMVDSGWHDTEARRLEQARRADMSLPRSVPDVPGQAERAPSRWPVPPALLVINGYRHAGLSYQVPTTAAELERWASILDNCLADYVRAAATNTAWLVGVFRDDVIIGCVEIRPRTREVRQAVGEHNRPLDSSTLERVIQALARCDVTR